MPKPASPALVLFAALALAVLADILLHGASWGINIAVLGLSVAATCAFLLRRTPRRLGRANKVLAVFALVFALMYAFRDANGLRIANGVGLILCAGAMLVPMPVGGIRTSTIGTLLWQPVWQLVLLFERFGRLARASKSHIAPSEDSRRRNTAIARGLIIATPLVLLFGGLFTSADAVFRGKVENMLTLNLDVGLATSHGWTLLFSLVIAGGLLYRLVLYAAEEDRTPDSTTPGQRAGIIETGIVLGALNMLFAAFLGVQFRYLFGAQDVVTATNGLSYAEYAREGFFQLVCVAALALVVLVGADAIVDKSRAPHRAIFLWLGRSLAVMVFCVIASAVMRMKLYTDAFGLTELRVYSTAFMGWLTITFGWLFFSTLANKPRRFAFGGFVSGLLVILGLNLMDPEGLMVRTNLPKPGADLAYLKTLSNDAALAMLKMGDQIPESRRAECQEFVRSRRDGVLRGDWRESNLVRWSLAREVPAGSMVASALPNEMRAP